MASVLPTSATVLTDKTATATGAASSGPILLIAIGAIVGIGAVIAWAKSDSKTTEDTKNDKLVLQHL